MKINFKNILNLFLFFILILGISYIVYLSIQTLVSTKSNKNVAESQGTNLVFNDFEYYDESEKLVESIFPELNYVGKERNFETKNEIEFIVHPLWGKYSYSQNDIYKKNKNIEEFEKIQEAHFIKKYKFNVENDNKKALILVLPLKDDKEYDLKNLTIELKQIFKEKNMSAENIYYMFSKESYRGNTENVFLSKFKNFNGKISFAGGYMGECFFSFINDFYFSVIDNNKDDVISKINYEFVIVRGDYDYKGLFEDNDILMVIKKNQFDIFKKQFQEIITNKKNEYIKTNSEKNLNQVQLNSLDYYNSL